MILSFASLSRKNASIILTAAALLSLACGDPSSAPAGSNDFDVSPPENLTDGQLETLARTYLYEPASEDEGDRILKRIQSLDPDTAARFATVSRHLQVAEHGQASQDDDSEEVRRIDDLINERASQMGVNRYTFVGNSALIDLFPVETSTVAGFPAGGEIGTLSQPSCGFGYATCNWTNVWPTSLSGGGPLGSYGGVWGDRLSNLACEPIACDHRIAYSINYAPTKASGASPAAQCVVNHYSPNILSSYANGTASALYGIQGPAQCGIAVAVNTYLVAYTRVQ